ncbi:sugar-transfer associated ATP-grasp domain-containing protein [Rhodohalobacter sp. 8-1]|uniref:sugar-transfer associated ATP-grasp domain-containing protein n=1 Tax=Rhodohalobacter sp. 8-1 TaxID=3131972 RepID=UPI0030EC7195
MNYDLALAYVDKNNYENLFGDLNHPETVLRYMKRKFHNSSIDPISEAEAKNIIQKTTYPLIVKPTISSSGGGRNVRLLSSESDIKNLIPFLKSCTEDFIIQKKIEQNSQLSRFNSTSLNTLRILTFRYGTDILYLSTVARFGRANSITDNKAGGGIFISVKPDGSLNNFGYSQNYLKIDKHPDSLKPFKGTVIDGFEKAVMLCITRHKRLPYFDLISWDIAIDEQNEPIMIELNLINQEINFHQVANGPLFGDYSEEIIKKSITEMNKSKYALTSF